MTMDMLCYAKIFILKWWRNSDHSSRIKSSGIYWEIDRIKNWSFSGDFCAIMMGNYCNIIIGHVGVARLTGRAKDLLELYFQSNGVYLSKFTYKPDSRYSRYIFRSVLIFDENWMLRNATATTLTHIKTSKSSCRSSYTQLW